MSTPVRARGDRAFGAQVPRGEAISGALILVNHPVAQDRRDFEEIKARIEEIAPDICVEIVDANNPSVDESVWEQPCLIVSFGSLKTFRPKRGLICCCRFIPKFEELVRLHRANVPVPLSATFAFDKQLDPRIWGPLVVLKPTMKGFMSHGSVFLMRPHKVAEFANLLFPVGHPARKDLLVQRFIDTGETPSHYRALTLFGEPLYCLKFYGDQPLPPLDAPDELLINAHIATNIIGTTRKAHTVSEVDVLDLARQAYAAIPGVPLQGVDIIREAATGRLFVLEINSGGNTWHFSSRYIARRGRPVPRDELIEQFGAWDTSAHILVKAVRHQAR